MASMLEHCQALPRQRFTAGQTVLEEGAVAGVLHILTDDYILTHDAVEIVTTIWASTATEDEMRYWSSGAAPSSHGRAVRPAGRVCSRRTRPTA